MRTLHKYLTRQVLASLLLSVVVFTFVLLLGNVLKETLTLLINGQARFSTVLEAIGLLVPFVLVFALPMGLLTATLLVFGRFSADQELIAARASGISLLSLTMPILLLSLFCCALSAWINMDLGPRSRVAYKELLYHALYHARNDLTRLRLPEEQFFRDIPNCIIWIHKNHDGDLQGIRVWLLQDETNLVSYVSAPRGRVTLDMHNRQLIIHLLNPLRLTFLANGGVQSQFYQGWFPYTYPLPSMKRHTYHPAISDMTFWQLHDELNDLNHKLSLPSVANAKESETTRAQLRVAETQQEHLKDTIRVEMSREIAFSFACFSFTLIGIPLGIRVHRRETNIGVAIALVLVLVYYAFIMLGESLSGRPEFHPQLIFWIPNFLFQAVGAVLLWRANRGI